MEYLNYIQLKLLKNINKGKITSYDALDDIHQSACSYLEQKGFVDHPHASGLEKVHGVYQVISDAALQITEEGKAQLQNEHNARWLVTFPDIIGFVLSVIAILISLKSMMLI